MSPRSDSVSNESVRFCDDAISAPTSRADNDNKIDPDLALLIDAWPTLPAALKTGIVAMIEAAQK